MCSFASCQTRFEFLSQFRKVRNALPKTKRVWPMKINVICTVYYKNGAKLLVFFTGCELSPVRHHLFSVEHLARVTIVATLCLLKTS